MLVWQEDGRTGSHRAQESPSQNRGVAQCTADPDLLQGLPRALARRASRPRQLGDTHTARSRLTCACHSPCSGPGTTHNLCACMHGTCHAKPTNVHACAVCSSHVCTCACAVFCARPMHVHVCSVQCQPRSLSGQCLPPGKPQKPMKSDRLLTHAARRGPRSDRGVRAASATPEQWVPGPGGQAAQQQLPFQVRNARKVQPQATGRHAPCQPPCLPAGLQSSGGRPCAARVEPRVTQDCAGC